MDWSGSAIICTVRAHGETGVIVRLLAADAGLLAGYVRGGQSRRQRAVLMPGNVVRAQWRARVADQLGGLTVELETSRATLMLGDRLTAAALGWVTALAGSVLPEHIPYPAIHHAIVGLLDAMGHTDDPRAWLAGLVKTELLILADLGFGVDLSSCAATGQTEDLAYVSPRSTQAVSRAAGAPYAAKLLPLPTFLIDRAAPMPDWPDLRDGLALTGFFLERHLLTDRAAPLMDARARLVAMVRQTQILPQRGRGTAQSAVEGPGTAAAVPGRPLHHPPGGPPPPLGEDFVHAPKK